MYSHLWHLWYLHLFLRSISFSPSVSFYLSLTTCLLIYSIRRWCSMLTVTKFVSWPLFISLLSFFLFYHFRLFCRRMKENKNKCHSIHFIWFPLKVDLFCVRKRELVFLYFRLYFVCFMAIFLAFALFRIKWFDDIFNVLLQVVCLAYQAFLFINLLLTMNRFVDEPTIFSLLFSIIFHGNFFAIRFDFFVLHLDMNRSFYLQYKS